MIDEECIRKIVREEITAHKEKNDLIKLVKQRRHYTRLTGHSKIDAEKRCICGETLIQTNKKSGGWLCEKEEKEWDYIIHKLTGGQNETIN